MELTLDTEGIGPIRFIMETVGDVIRVHLVAQQADVLDLLRHHAADLIAGLQEAGYREAQMSFGAWQRPPTAPDRCRRYDRGCGFGPPRGNGGCLSRGIGYQMVRY